MALFDIFKKKPSSENEGSGNHDILVRYAEYIVICIHFQQQGNLAPIAAYTRPDGSLDGHLYMNPEDFSYSIGAAEATERMRANLDALMAKGEASSYLLLYHSADGQTPTDDEDSFTSIALAFREGSRTGIASLGYTHTGDEVRYSHIKELSPQQNTRIFNTELRQVRDSFGYRLSPKPEPVENAAGIKITYSNALDLSNTWSGIFGFERHRNGNGLDTLKETILRICSTETPKNHTDSLQTVEGRFGPVGFKCVVAQGSILTSLPVIHTPVSIDVENHSIDEWENIDGAEAVISAQGRGTFGLSYFATDYAENRHRYLSRKKQHVHISGIVYVVDESKTTPTEGETQFSPDFTGYFPYKELAHYGCIEFVGMVEDVEPIALLSDGSLPAYLLRVRLITDTTRPDLFTIHMYATPENIRFAQQPQKGMKLSGVCQLQGYLGEEF